MSLKYQPKKSDYGQNNISLILKIASIIIIVLSLLTIFLCFKKSPRTEATQKSSKIITTNKKIKNTKKAKTKKAPKASEDKPNVENIPVVKTIKKINKEPPNPNLTKAKVTNPKVKKSVKAIKNSKKKKKKKALAQAKTEFPNDQSQVNRVFNIKKAVKILNNTVLKPNEEFTFENVYSLSHKNGKFKCTKDYNTKEIVYAGGLSQISTTLYHAVKKAKLPITERHCFNHKVFYSNDTAMFRHLKANFKFKNSKNFSIRIKASVVKNCIKIKILKAKKPKPKS